jgi:hypothetical protein
VTPALTAPVRLPADAALTAPLNSATKTPVRRESTVNQQNTGNQQNGGNHAKTPATS